MTKKQITKSEFQELSKVMDEIEIIRKYEIIPDNQPRNVTNVEVEVKTELKSVQKSNIPVVPWYKIKTMHFVQEALARFLGWGLLLLIPLMISNNVAQPLSRNLAYRQHMNMSITSISITTTIFIIICLYLDWVNFGIDKEHYDRLTQQLYNLKNVCKWILTVIIFNMGIIMTNYSIPTYNVLSILFIFALISGIICLLITYILPIFVSKQNSIRLLITITTSILYISFSLFAIYIELAINGASTLTMMIITGITLYGIIKSYNLLSSSDR